MRFSLLGALALLLALPATAPAASSQNADRVVHQYTDEVKTATGVETRTVEIIVEGATGRSVEVVRDASGAVLSRMTIQPTSPSAEEVADARAIIEADAELSSLMRSRPAHIDGGYPLVEADGMACGPGARCLHMDLLNDADRRERIRFVVVDLVSRTVVYPDFDPDAHGRMH
jgi:hypothetical protein